LRNQKIISGRQDTGKARLVAVPALEQRHVINSTEKKFSSQKIRRAPMKKDDEVVAGRKLARMMMGATRQALRITIGIPTRAQNAEVAVGCGPDNEHFDVKTNKGQHTEAKEDNGKAAVHFLQDDREFQSIQKPVLRIGIDGKWIGATHGTSYVVALLDPGKHHLCTSWQASVGRGVGRQSGALHFVAETGKSYFSLREAAGTAKLEQCR
jgi:hypothetical protein